MAHLRRTSIGVARTLGTSTRVSRKEFMYDIKPYQQRQPQFLKLSGRLVVPVLFAGANSSKDEASATTVGLSHFGGLHIPPYRDTEGFNASQSQIQSLDPKALFLRQFLFSLLSDFLPKHSQESAAERDLARRFAGDITNPELASKISLATDCTNEVFLCKDKWIFKPQPLLEIRAKDESSSRDGISPRQEYLREIAAYHLDRINGSFAGVPTTVGFSLRGSDTALLRTLCVGERFKNAGITSSDTLCGSVQQWVEHTCCSEDMGPSRFSTSDVHRIGLLDLRLFNTDRHGGNLLVTSDNHLVPIDHGLCLPDIRCGLGQAEAKEQFSKATVQWVDMLDSNRDAQLLRSLGFSNPCILTLCFCTEVLKFAILELGWNLKRIGMFFSRMFGARSSQLEELVHKAYTKWGTRLLRITWEHPEFWRSDFRVFLERTMR